jgi:hypothetical protein
MQDLCFQRRPHSGVLGIRNSISKLWKIQFYPYQILFQKPKKKKGCYFALCPFSTPARHMSYLKNIEPLTVRKHFVQQKPL